MSNAIVVASSTLAGGVLTVVLKASGSTPIESFQLALTPEAGKVASITGTGPAGWTTLVNSATPGIWDIAGFSGLDGQGNPIPVTSGQTAVTLTITLANTADTSLNFTFGGEVNDPAVAIAAAPFQAGDGFLNSPVQGTVALTGSPIEDQVLTATASLTDGDGVGATLTYHWLRDGVEASSGTSNTYTLTDADVGKKISVQVTYTDNAGHAESKTSTETLAVGNINDTPTGNITISGTTTEGATLTAVSTLADADGMGTLSYVWAANGTSISGATSSTYQLQASDVGKTITVQAVYTDGHGTVEFPISAATAAVQANHAPSGVLAINGTKQQNQTLTLDDSTLVDTDGGITGRSYQWFADGTAISGATNNTLVLTQAQVGKAITATVSYTDGLGKSESMTSSPTVAIQNVNDAATGTVMVMGTAKEDQTLSASPSITDPDGFSPGMVTYQWYADGTAIGGATSMSYTLTQAEVGKAITVKASYTDLLGSPENVTSAATAAVQNVNDAPVGTVTITGTATQNQTLTASHNLTDEDVLGTVGYQWFANGTAIGGATGTSYTLTQAEVGKTITVKASYTDGQNTAETVQSASTAAVLDIDDAATGALTIGGYAAANPSKGQTLTIVNTVQDLDGGVGSISYQWLKDGVAIAGATGATLALTDADVGKTFSVQGTYTDAFGAKTVTSAATGPVQPNTPATGTVTLSGTVQQGSTVTAQTANLADGDGMPTAAGSVTFTWQLDGTDIAGATASTLTLTEAHVGKTLTAKANFTDLLGSSESLVSTGSVVANLNDALQGNVTIAGTAAEGQTLTASNNFSDADGMGSVSYQWFANGTAISGATSSTLALTQAHVNKVITVEGSYTDGHGTAEKKTSAATAQVQNVNNAAAGAPTISGTPTQGQTLQAVTSGISDTDGLGIFNFQWMAGGVAIAGATSSSLTLTQAQVDKAISVKVSYTDAFGTPENVTSTSTPAVANVNDSPTGAVNIDGARVVGSPLTANISTVADADGLGSTINYQWKLAGVDISGATSKDYTPVATDEGKNITVEVSYTDALGSAETLTSGAVAVVNENNVDKLVAPGVTAVAGDGNGDGIADASQDEVLSAPLTVQGGGSPTFITLVVDSTESGAVNTGSTGVIQTLDQEVAPDTKPKQLAAPLGLIDFTATTEVGQTETFTLFVDRSLRVNGYWKVDEDGTWVNLASKPFGGSTTAVGNKIRLDFKITDGGEFDNDGLADGIITDPAIIGEMELSVVGYTADVTLTPNTHFFF